ncbi:hypothetical protein BGZ80_005922, partial [Entomortierella chlamydospora]
MFPTPVQAADTEVGNAIEGLHKFFYEERPAQWTPTHFAKRPDATDYYVYIKGLHRIKNEGPISLSTYCASIIKFLKEDPHGIEEESEAKRSIEVRTTIQIEKEEELIFKSNISTNFLKRRSEEESSTEAQTSWKPKSRFQLAAGCSTSPLSGSPLSYPRTPSPLRSGTAEHNSFLAHFNGFQDSSDSDSARIINSQINTASNLPVINTTPAFEDVEQFFQNEQLLQDAIVDSLQSGKFYGLGQRATRSS